MTDAFRQCTPGDNNAMRAAAVLLRTSKMDLAINILGGFLRLGPLVG